MYITQCLHRAMQQKPDTVAICGPDRRTFRQLIDRVARLAAGLRGLGMAPGDRVAILALNSARYLEYQLAVLWGGGVLNPCNFRWTAPELGYSLSDCESTLLIVDDSFVPLAGSLRRDVRGLRSVIHAGDGESPEGMIGYEALIADHGPMDDTARRGSDLAGIFYTGGTTGLPKGVMLSHTNLYSSALALVGEGMARPGSTYLHAAPMFHLADLGFSLAQLVQGNCHAFIQAFSPDQVLDAIERHRVTHTLLVPTMIHALLERMGSHSNRDLSSLKVVAYGAAPVSEALIKRASAALPHVDLLQAYGMTELAPLATINPPDSYAADGRTRSLHLSSGRAGLCVEVRIADASDHEVARGMVGEVLVRGPNVMLGYWKKPQETQQALRGGWMHTGDAAYMDDGGFIYIVDRLKDMIISGGENVYSAEVENALAQHPNIAACAVIGVPDTYWGERVHAFVVLRPGAAVTSDELIEHCRALIAGYKCPRSIEFTESLPMSAVGKVLKTELRRRAYGDSEAPLN